MYIFSNLGQPSPLKVIHTTPVKAEGAGSELREDVVRFYKTTGLETIAKEVFYFEL